MLACLLDTAWYDIRWHAWRRHCVSQRYCLGGGLRWAHVSAVDNANCPSMWAVWPHVKSAVSCRMYCLKSTQNFAFNCVRSDENIRLCNRWPRDTAEGLRPYQTNNQTNNVKTDNAQRRDSRTLHLAGKRHDAVRATVSAAQQPNSELAIPAVFDLPGSGGLTPTGWGWPLTGDRKYWFGGSTSVMYYALIRVSWTIKFHKSSRRWGHDPKPHWRSLQRCPDPYLVGKGARYPKGRNPRPCEPKQSTPTGFFDKTNMQTVPDMRNIFSSDRSSHTMSYA